MTNRPMTAFKPISRLVCAALIALSRLAAPQTTTAQTFEQLYQDIWDSLGINSVANTGLTAFPTLQIAFGGEQAGMAGAYSAVGREIAFLDSNPAAGATLENTELAFLHKNLIADVNLEGVAYSMRFGDLSIGGIAKFLHVDFAAIGTRGEQLAAGRFFEAVVAVNLSYNLFRSFFFHGLSIGTNLKFAYRHVPATVYTHVLDPTVYNQDAPAWMADFGVLTRFDALKFYASRTRNVTVAAVLKNFGPPALGDPLPTELVLGLGYAPVRPLLFAFDFAIPWNLVTPENSEEPHIAAGVAARFTDFLSVQAGFGLRAGNPRITVGVGIDLPAISFAITYLADLTNQFDRPDLFSVQGRLNFGDQGRAELRTRVETLYYDALVALATGELEHVIALCEQALELDPRFEPAQLTLTNARRTLALQEQIEQIRLDPVEEASASD